MALIGYARVSSVGQSFDVQIDKLAHCQKVFQEKRSGISDRRPRLKACLEYVRDGEVLAVTWLDRLVRSTLHLCQRRYGPTAVQHAGGHQPVRDRNPR